MVPARNTGLDASPPVRRRAFETQAMTAWDTRLLTFVRQVLETSTQRQIVVDIGKAAPALGRQGRTQ